MKLTSIMPFALYLGLTAFSAAAGEGWLTDFDKAKQEAARTKRPILADFSGSDWCTWCIRLNKEVFSRADFKAFAKDNLILFKADFPRINTQPAELKKQNKGLGTTYSIRGYPTVLLLNAAGKELARTGYQKGGAAAYVKHLKELLKANDTPSKTPAAVPPK